MSMLSELKRTTAVVVLLSTAPAWAAPGLEFDRKKGLVWSEPGAGHELRLGGRVQADSAWFDDDVTPMEDESDLRRARVGARLTLADDWRVRAEYDFGGVIDGWKSVYLQYRGFEDWRVTAGNQVTPFSLADLTSSSYLPFMERPLVSALAPGMLTGLAVKHSGESWSLAGGVFGDELSDRERRQYDGTGAIARGSRTFGASDATLLHIGASFEYREPADNEIRLRSRPESYMTDRRLTDTRRLGDVDDSWLFGIESALVRGPFAIRGEYLGMTVSRSASDDVDFSGWYATANVMLTGERVRFSRRNGTFRSVRPHRGWGAVELAVRYSTLDLNDGDVTGGEQRNVSVGLNWYVNTNLRLMANAIAFDADPNRDGVDEDGRIYQLRLQATL